MDELYIDTAGGSGNILTFRQRLGVRGDQILLSAEEYGPAVMEDFHFREKITHFNQERIHDPIVQAGGGGAHGYFESYGDFSEFTKAGFLGVKGKRTPVFTRFSTEAGFKGSSNLARDIRGFAVKFYTEEGNFDLVGSNMPVFFTQDAMKYSDLIHTVKPDQRNEIPQAAFTHDTFWDLISLMPESMHMIMWLMSDSALPRSFSSMEGYGGHTFRLINEHNESHFVKFHWRPRAGTCSVTWDEAQQISGRDPDYHRRELWNAIENWNFPEWDFGVQLVPEKDEYKFDFDLLDPTKLIPEELVPVKLIGKMVLNANSSNFSAEAEQITFHPGRLVPGIDFSQDPLLQGRLFSYTDSRLSGFGGPNCNEIQINRPVAPLHNNQWGGHMRQASNVGQSSYQPHRVGGGFPFSAKVLEGGFTPYSEKIEEHKIRKRGSSFMDHFSQAKLFYESQTKVEQAHIIKALRIELGKVMSGDIRERMVGMLSYINDYLAQQVAEGLLINPINKFTEALNHGFPADDPKDCQPKLTKFSIENSEKFDLIASTGKGIKGRHIAVLAGEGVDADSLNAFVDGIEKEGADVKVISIHGGFIGAANGEVIKVDQSLLTASSVLFDAVFVPAGARSSRMLQMDPAAIRFLDEAYKHCKYIAINGQGEELWRKTYASRNDDPKGVLFDQDVTAFIKAIAKHRIWEREDAMLIPV